MTLHSIYLGRGLIAAIYTLLAIVNAVDVNGRETLSTCSAKAWNGLVSGKMREAEQS